MKNICNFLLRPCLCNLLHTLILQNICLKIYISWPDQESKWMKIRGEGEEKANWIVATGRSTWWLWDPKLITEESTRYLLQPVNSFNESFIFNSCPRTCTVKGKYVLLSSIHLRTYTHKANFLPLSSHTDNNNYMLTCSTWMTVTKNYWETEAIFILFLGKIISFTHGQNDYWHKWNMDVPYLLISASKEVSDGFRFSYLCISRSVFTSHKSLNDSQIFR